MRFLLFLFLFSSLSASSQFLNEEKKINDFGKKLLSKEIDNLNKSEILSTFNQTLFSLLDTNKNTDNYKFDSLKTTLILVSKDKLLRIFSYNFCLVNKPCMHYSILQYRDRKNKKFNTFILTPNSSKRINEEDIHNQDYWYGAIYYELIQKKHKRKKYYTLLGYDESQKEIGIKRKIIDVITLNKNDSIQFGYPMFNIGKQTKNKIVFQYSSDLGMSLSYKNNKIVFDHLSPKNPSMEGFYKFYGPDFSYDALKFSKGKWVLMKDIIPKNKKAK